MVRMAVVVCVVVYDITTMLIVTITVVQLIAALRSLSFAAQTDGFIGGYAFTRPIATFASMGRSAVRTILACTAATAAAATATAGRSTGATTPFFPGGVARTLHAYTLLFCRFWRRYIDPM